MKFKRNDMVYAPHIGREVYILKRNHRVEDTDYKLSISDNHAACGSMSTLVPGSGGFGPSPELTDVTEHGVLYKDGGLPVVFPADKDYQVVLTGLYGGSFTEPPETVTFTINGVTLTMLKGVTLSAAIAKAEEST